MLSIQMMFFLLLGTLRRESGPPRAPGDRPPGPPSGAGDPRMRAQQVPANSSGGRQLTGMFIRGFGAGCVIFAVYVGTLSYLDGNRAWQAGGSPEPAGPANSLSGSPEPAAAVSPQPDQAGQPAAGAAPDQGLLDGPRSLAATSRAPDAGAGSPVSAAAAAPDTGPAAVAVHEPASPTAPAVSPRRPRPQDREPLPLYEQGLEYMMKGDNQRALDQFSEVIVRFPSYAPAFKGLGLAYEKLGNKAMAHAALNRYLSLEPGASDSDLIRRRLKTLD